MLMQYDLIKGNISFLSYLLFNWLISFLFCSNAHQDVARGNPSTCLQALPLKGTCQCTAGVFIHLEGHE